MAKEMYTNCYETVLEAKKAFNGYLADYIQMNKSSGSGGGSKGGTMSGKNTVVPRIDAMPNAAPDLLPVPGTNAVFVDLDTVAWAVESIEGLCAINVLHGYSDGTFRPNDPVTREQFLKMLLEYLKLTDESARCDFDDVEQNAWYSIYVATGNKLGIINGMGEKLFGIGREITRQDMAVMMYKALSASGIVLPEGEVQASDGNAIDGYAVEAVEKLMYAGVLNGMEDGSFRPHQVCTRAQAAKVIYAIGEVEK